MSRPPLFKSFWIAGYEGACHINESGTRLDMTAFVQHDRQVAQDYALLHNAGIATVRESVRWPLIERFGQFDYSSITPMLKAAHDNGIQIIWTLCHYGWPEEIDVFSAAFVDRFARFCGNIAGFIGGHSNAIPYYNPINEISFLSWAICHTAIMYPYASHGKGRDAELKRQLVRAEIAACEAIWAVDARARIVNVDPIIHIIAPPDRPDLADAARAQRASQFEAWDMLGGYASPELGGDPKYLDIIGVNYYHSNQWEYLTNDRLHWHLKDPRRMPLHQLLAEVYQRYQHPIFIGETSHVGTGRGQWIKEIAEEVCLARSQGVPVDGICLYPILDRPDWENDKHWHNSGLWDLQADDSGHFHRILNENYATDLSAAQSHLANEECSFHPTGQTT
jgi:UDP-galactopyranose mutase